MHPRPNTMELARNSALKCSGRSTYRKPQLRKSRRSNNINSRINKMKGDMEVISKEQKVVKKGQEEVKQKMMKIEAECRGVRKETELIMEQRAGVLVRLGLISQILKAKKESNFSKAAELVNSLRELIGKQDKPE